MINTQKKCKHVFMAIVLFAFATCTISSQAAVERHNLTPYLLLGGAGLTAFITAVLLEPENLYAMLEEKAIDAWIAKNDLNKFGEPKDTVYQDAVNGPLERKQSRIDYINAKFIDEDIKPWRSGFVRLLNYAVSLRSRASKIAAAGLSVALISFVASLILELRHSNAVWDENIAIWKAESAEIDKKMISDITSAVAAGVVQAQATPNTPTANT